MNAKVLVAALGGLTLTFVVVCNDGGKAKSRQGSKGSPATLETATPRPAPEETAVAEIFDESGAEASDDRFLNLPAEADQSQLTNGWSDSVSRVHKIGSEQIVFFSTSGHSWLLSSKEPEVLRSLAPPFKVPEGSACYTMPGQRFWIVSNTSVAVPVSVQSTSTDGPILTNVIPEVVKENGGASRVLFVGINHLILANANRLNILILSEAKVNQVIMDLPKSGGKPAELKTMGLLAKDQGYWATTDTRLYTLKKVSGNWLWHIRDLKADLGTGSLTPATQIAMIMGGNDDRIVLDGHGVAFLGGKIFSDLPLKPTAVVGEAAP